LAWLTWFFLVLSAITGLGTFVYLKKQQAKETGNAAADNTTANPSHKAKSSKGNLKDFWEVQDVQKGVLILAPGNRYRLVLRLMAQDFFLLSEGEQNAIEDSQAAALLGLDFPIQTLVTSEALDTRQIVTELRQTAPSLPEKIKNHALERANYLENIRQKQAVTAKNAYLIIPFDTTKGFDHAYSELMARAASLADGLLSAKIMVEPLDTNGVCDLIAHMLNRGRVWIPSEAGEMGIMSLYHISERQVKDDAV